MVTAMTQSTAQALYANNLFYHRNTASVTAEHTEKRQTTLESRIAESYETMSSTQRGVEMYGGFTRSNNSILQKLSDLVTKYVSRRV